MVEPKPTRVVLPKEGRLKRDVAALLSDAGFTASQESPRHDFGILFDRKGELPPIEFVTQRPFDTLDCIRGEVGQVGIVGLDILYEFEGDRGPTDSNVLDIAARLEGCSRCSLYVAGPAYRLPRNPAELAGLRIATAYPRSTAKWLRAHGLSGCCSIVIRQGSVEDAVRLGLADVICDLVNSGESLTVNRLVRYFHVYESTAVAITHTDAPRPSLVDVFLSRLLAACSTASCVTSSSSRDGAM